MKYFLLIFFIAIGTVCSAQKYALIDKQMSLPVVYVDVVSVQDNFKGYFPVEKAKLMDFIAEIEKIKKPPVPRRGNLGVYFISLTLASLLREKFLIKQTVHHPSLREGL